MNYDLIIWDFNGTILDDVALGISSVNKMLEKRSLPALKTAEEYREKLTFPIEDYYRALGFDFDAEPYSLLAHEWVELYRAGENECPPCTGVKEALEALSAAGAEQMILSASEEGMLLSSLRRLGFESYFTKITAKDNVYAEGKLDIARRLAEKIRGKRAVMVGDTVHDYEAAQILDADCVLFTGGHGRYADLAGLSVPLVGDLREVIDFCLRCKNF